MRARPSSRRLAVLGLSALAVVALVGVTRRADDVVTSSAADTTTSPAESARTATVSRRDLARTIEVDGTLGYGDPRTIRDTGPGTITGLPEPGVVVRPNEPLYQVDGGAGPILLDGVLPMWRPLHVGVDDGPDVAQLEANLTYLGMADGLTVDEEFTTATAEAIETWQESHGLDETGRVEIGDIWFASDPLRVASTTAEVGDPANGEVLTVTDTNRLVRVEVDVADARYAVEGATVDIELTDGTEATGTVTDVAATATATAGPPEGGEELATTVAVEITPDSVLDALDESPLTVSLVSDEVTDVLAVPLEAVVARPDGTYALEVVHDDGTTGLVEVELGRFADGWVQVSGAVSEGETVVTA